MPKLDKKTIQEIIANPYETRSVRDPRYFLLFPQVPRKSVPHPNQDSFYFVDGELVMHHRKRFLIQLNGPYLNSPYDMGRMLWSIVYGPYHMVNIICYIVRTVKLD